MGDSKFSFFAADIILLVVFLGLALLTFKLSGLKFLLAILFVVILLFISFIALIPAYSGSRGGWGFLTGVFVLILIYLLAIFIKTSMAGKAFLITLLFAAIGFVISIANIKKEEAEEPVAEEKGKEEKEEAVYTNFEPGKYVASKMGSVYHIPKCDWANNIKEENRVWFNSDEEAKRKKYKKHDCLK